MYTRCFPKACISTNSALGTLHCRKLLVGREAAALSSCDTSMRPRCPVTPDLVHMQARALPETLRTILHTPHLAKDPKRALATLLATLSGANTAPKASAKAKKSVKATNTGNVRALRATDSSSDDTFYGWVRFC